MYNKLFTKLLDSSIWLESTSTRIVWLTLLAVMDETGFARFAAIGNVANRARVTLAEADAALKCLESPDPESSDPEHEGRRIQRVPGGWVILNAGKHRDLVTRAASQEQTRLRVQRYRERLKRRSNEHVTTGNDLVTRSEAYTEVQARSSDPNNKLVRNVPASSNGETSARAGRLREELYPTWYATHRHGARLRLVANSLEFQDALSLVVQWDDAHLEKLAQIILTTDDEWISNTDRGFKIFALKASWADNLFREWETNRKAKS